MPRRPVNPQDRQRVVRACDQCKSSKKRCNGSQPCTPCERKGYHAICHYTAGRRLHPLPRQSSNSSRLPTQNTRWDSDGGASNIARQSFHETDTISPRNTGSDGHAETRQRSSEDSLERDTRESSIDALGEPPVMLSSITGEKVFIGNTAALSFLRFIQKTLKRHIGPSGFTDTQESQKLFEADTSDTESSRFYTSLSVEDKRAYVQYFLDASNGLLDLYSWEDVSQLLRNTAMRNSVNGQSIPQERSDLETASLYLMVAIGAQCCGPTKEAVGWAAGLFCHARKLALERMLEEPSLDLVRVFLLMAFYMFGACRRNSAFMYLGVASKAADILGLHMSAQYKHLSIESRRARLRTAKSIRVFDVICNSILGRPSSTPSLRPGHTSYVSDEVNDGSDVVYRALALGATYEIAAVLDNAVSKSAEGVFDTAAAEKLVLALQQRSRNFPAILRRQNDADASYSRSVTIGNTHVSGAYYFSVILVTRHFLIQHLVPQISKNKDVDWPNMHNSDHGSAEKRKVAELADACVEAATFMAQMCHQIMQSGQMLGNMCILKAWMFATGLVLGFSLLAEDASNNPGRRTAFLKSLHVLGKLKHLSPQAEQYYNILSSFHQAIKAYQEQQHRNKHASRVNLVDRVFLPEEGAGFDEPEIIATQLPSPEMTIQDSASVDWLNNIPFDALNEISPVDPALIGENDVIMRMLWESDRYVTDYPAGMLPDADADMSLEPSVAVYGSLTT
ncbi:hypothetical protein FB567DRAFT_41482 [Paraphoma chrysanthemicola]|uniref:Zn(2)-C6 fungal-type domain-containing protein n=1 Tax=Paraphoma chrysanthemicola TaxID=798071 RepID=A0A8K0RME6_9PLEO|nr:hypothetical protein FB567DRAFT_41482 [Paraphoma chrysanthemicola]